jgi:hypothetical protein
MKKTSICILLFLAFLEVHAQFSLGADLLGMGLSRSAQNEEVLRLDTNLASSRLVFSINANLVGAYKFKHWEFSLGVGHENYFWKQKFDAPTEDLKALIGSNSLSDSSDILRRITYSSKLITLPVGVKYLFGNKPDAWANAFLSIRLTPTFTHKQKADPVFRDKTSFLFPVAVDEDPALVDATKAYFLAKVNTFLLDGKAEAGFRLWGNKRKYAVDFSIGYLYGFIPLHEQMGSTKGLFGNLALRFFFKSKSSADGLI